MKKEEISTIFNELYKCFSPKLTEELVNIIDENKDNPKFSSSLYISKALRETYKYSIKTCEEAIIKLFAED